MCFRPAETTMKAHNICGECGEENPPGETVCFKCGAKIGFAPKSMDQLAPTGAPASAKPPAASTPAPPKASTPKVPTPPAPAKP